VAEEKARAALSAKTGNPERPWSIWLALLASYAAVAVLGVALGLCYWTAVDDFAHASWLMGLFPTEVGSAERVLLAVAVTFAALIPAIACVISGFYGWSGYRWARWAALVTLVLSFAGWLINVWTLAACALTLLALLAFLLPPSARFFRAWHALRHPESPYADAPAGVYYGPLPKYREIAPEAVAISSTDPTRPRRQADTADQAVEYQETYSA
jgi:uncharacterized membrane protein